jgi:hypothetical protein
MLGSMLSVGTSGDTVTAPDLKGATAGSVPDKHHENERA